MKNKILYRELNKRLEKLICMNSYIAILCTSMKNGNTLYICKFSKKYNFLRTGR